jgi:hypothetical protein
VVRTTVATAPRSAAPEPRVRPAAGRATPPRRWRGPAASTHRRRPASRPLAGHRLPDRHLPAPVCWAGGDQPRYTACVERQVAGGHRLQPDLAGGILVSGSSPAMGQHSARLLATGCCSGGLPAAGQRSSILALFTACVVVRSTLSLADLRPLLVRSTPATYARTLAASSATLRGS